MNVVLSTDPIKFPLTGIGRYTYELARGLQNAHLESLYFLRGLRLQKSLPKLDDAQPMSNTPTWKDYAQKSRLTVALYRTVAPFLKGRILKGLENHVFHSPNYYLPPFAGRSVVTLHDLSPFLWSQSHPPERVRYMRAEIELSLKRAAALITDTEYTRQEVAAYFNWPLERIHAVHLASAPEFKPRTHAELQRTLVVYGLTPSHYTLFTGTIEPRKNIDVLLDAYAQLPTTTRLNCPLVVVGYRGWHSEKLHRRFEQAQQAGWLKYLGFVPHEVLPILMAGARLFAYPSLYEGFGLPVLEAMACGVPVVCSNASTLPEVAGNAAAYHHPKDVDLLQQLLQIGVEDQSWREQAIVKGLQQANKFSWERCTQETLKVYGDTLAA